MTEASTQLEALPQSQALPQTDAQPLLAVRGVKTYYGKIIALKGVDIDVNAGEIVTMIGANGAGKSTLMMTIFGNPQAREGMITYEGRDITRMQPHRRAAGGIAYVPQGRDIFARMTVQENLLMGMATMSRREAATIAGEVYELFPVLKAMLGRRGGDLSGGQQQQLAIARALLQRPALIILDEPTEGIQPSIIKDIERVIQMLRQRGDIGILLCEQYFDFARALADNFVVLSRGEVVASGSAAQMDGEHVRRHLAV